MSIIIEPTRPIRPIRPEIPRKPVTRRSRVNTCWDEEYSAERTAAMDQYEFAMEKYYENMEEYYLLMDEYDADMCEYEDELDDYRSRLICITRYNAVLSCLFEPPSMPVSNKTEPDSMVQASPAKVADDYVAGDLPEPSPASRGVPAGRKSRRSPLRTRKRARRGPKLHDFRLA